MRETKLTIADALRADPAVGELVPVSQVLAVERAVIPTLPAIEVIAIGSSRVDGGPLVKHELSIECTVSHPSEDGADALLDSIVAAVRVRLLAAEYSTVPISLAGGGNVLVELGGVRWSVSASDKASVVRGASIGVSAEVSE